jgi:hypothetical protein
MSSSVLSKRELVKTIIKERARDKEISCPVLRKIAEEVGISYKEAGMVADELNIKIRDCEFGCF